LEKSKLLHKITPKNSHAKAQRRKKAGKKQANSTSQPFQSVNFNCFLRLCAFA
jgi:hypothetical protein